MRARGASSSLVADAALCISIAHLVRHVETMSETSALANLFAQHAVCEPKFAS